ncbi:MAG: AAA family ATPase [Lachnospiraceae bacterium]|nr:AAA family ATPase [Lachnospiraceae bacterium]
MTDTLYSDEKLFELGKTNYDKLVLYCTQLEEKGFWTQAEKVMKQSSTEVLDLYVQSVLMNLAVHCGEILDSQREFMRVVTASNPLCIPKEGKIKRSVYNDSRRLYELPPVLIQLCGLYDKEHKVDMTEYFLDAFLNILLCMAYLNHGKDVKVNGFIQKYYEKIRDFIIDRDAGEHAEFIKEKISSGSIKCDAGWFKEKREKAAAKAAIKEDAGSRTGSDKSQKVKKQNNIQNTLSEEQKQEERRRLREAFFKRVEDDIRIEKERQEQEERQAKEQFLAVKNRLKEREKAEREEQEKIIRTLMEELNSLVGLKDVKGEIQSLANLIKIRKLREKMKMPVMDMSYHMVFTGSPGTGKTTVARLVGKIYKALGILSDGKMIETDRSGLVAGYVGQTAIKVHETVEQAIGGVLFIDEAYSLINPDVPNDFGSEAVDALVKLMEDHRDNLVIIVAGYTEEMKTFLKSNTGLISRFNKFINFPDYSKEELIEIMETMAEDAGLTIEEGAKERILKQLDNMKEEEWEDFGNARGIRNMFEKIVINQANRLVLLDAPAKEQLMTIVAEDVVN